MLAEIREAVASKGRLCVGLDPSPHQLSLWGLEPGPTGLEKFVDVSLQAIQGAASIVKPQVAFFEEFGVEGYRALHRLTTALRAEGVFVIADAKRGDIGSTMAGYLRGWLTPAGFNADALTVHSYLGMDVISNTAAGIELDNTRGFFALCATSNPEGAEIQRSLSRGKALARHIFDEAERLTTNQDHTVGVVIGATLDLDLFDLAELRDRVSEVPILAPGYGTQGASLSEIDSHFGASKPMVIPSVSRELAGTTAAGFRDRILAAQELVR